MTMTRGLAGVISDPGIDPRVRRALDRFARPYLWVTDEGITINDEGKLAIRLAVGGNLSQNADGIALSLVVRSVNAISSPTTASAAAGTHYIYLVSGTTTLTLPTAVGNTSFYTVKNVGAGVVTVATTSSQTIDGSQPITLPVANTALDIVSDGANWSII